MDEEGLMKALVRAKGRVFVDDHRAREAGPGEVAIDVAFAAGRPGAKKIFLTPTESR